MLTSETTLSKLEGTNFTTKLEALDPDCPNNSDVVQFSLDPPVPGVTVLSSGLLFWSSGANANTTINLILSDDCKTSSHQEILLAVMDCPCENSGTCIPQPDNPPGSMEFSCQCPEGTTGEFCDVMITTTTQLPSTTTSFTTVTPTTITTSDTTSSMSSVTSAASTQIPTMSFTTAATTSDATSSVSGTPSNEWSSWSEWSECSRTCDYGLRTRERQCLQGIMNTCPGSNINVELCSSGNCTGSILLIYICSYCKFIAAAVIFPTNSHIFSVTNANYFFDLELPNEGVTLILEETMIEVGYFFSLHTILCIHAK